MMKNNRLLSIRFMLFFPLFIFCGLCSGQDRGIDKAYEWPMAAGDAAWTGYSPDPTIKPPFRLKWAVLWRGGLRATSFSVGGGRLYGRSVCLDAETGDLMYKAGFGGDTPTYYKERLYVGGKGVRVIDAATGKRLWYKYDYRLSPDTGPTSVSLTVCDGAVYTGLIRKHEGNDTYFAAALDTENGRELWAVPLLPIPKDYKRPSSGFTLRTGMGVPSVGGGRVFVTTRIPGAVYALDRTNGRELWRQEGVWGQYGLSTDGKHVWAADKEQGVWALDAKTGRKLWHWGGTDKGRHKGHYLRLGTGRHPPMLAEGKLVLSNYGRHYTGLDARTGKLAWVAGDNDAPYGGSCAAPIGAAGHVYTDALIGKDYNGSLSRPGIYAVDVQTGKCVWKHPLSSKSCARSSVACSSIYVPGQYEICCFEAVPPDYTNEPQPPPARAAGPLSAMAKPFDGKPGDPGNKPEGGIDWPMQGGCPARCGLDINIGLPIKEAWKFNSGGRVRSSPIIAGGLVYAGSDSGKLFALELSTGRRKWSTPVNPPEESRDKIRWIRCAPAVAEGIVVCGADDGVMRAFEAKTGKPRWSFRTAGRIRSSPVIMGKRVVFGSWDGRCYCVRLSDGKEFWRYRVSDPGVRVYAPPAVARGRVYVGAWEDRSIHALDLGTGRPLAGFRFSPGRGVSIGLVLGLAVHRGFLMTAAWSKAKLSGRFFDPESGKGLGGAELLVKGSGSRARAGRYDGLRNPATDTIQAGDLTIGVNERGTLEIRRLSQKLGETAKLVWEWKSPARAEIWTAPAAAAGFIVIGSDDGHVYAFRYTKED